MLRCGERTTYLEYLKNLISKSGRLSATGRIGVIGPAMTKAGQYTAISYGQARTGGGKNSVNTGSSATRRSSRPSIAILPHSLSRHEGAAAYSCCVAPVIEDLRRRLRPRCTPRLQTPAD